MRIALALTTGLLLCILYVETQHGAPEPALNLAISTHGGLTATVGLGIDQPLRSFRVVQAGNTTTYINGAYRIQIRESSVQARSSIRVRVEQLSGEPFTVNNFSLAVRVPRNPIQGIWLSSAVANSQNVMAADATHSIDEIVDANYGIPYIGAVSYNLGNAFAMGLGRQDLPVSITGRPSDKNYYDFRMQSLAGTTAKVFDERFYISADNTMSWFQAAEDYADWADELNRYQPFPISPRAYEPVYDAWYWSGDQVDDRLYRQTAQLASEIGFGSYLADSGWDAPAGEYDKWLSGKTGDYNPPPDKFGNLSATFDAIRSEEKLGVTLWLQPFAVGRASSRYRSTRNIHIHIPPGNNNAVGWIGLTYPPFALPLGPALETVNLCPRVAATQTYLKNLFTEMEGKYKPQGYWLDFIDGMATHCVAPHSHRDALFGDGFRKTLDAIKTTILSANPQAVVQFRARYANLNTKPFANVWQTEDSPGDFDAMRLSSMRLRPFSKGVVFASDQLYWPDTADEVTVAKFIVTSVMTGVPAFGPTLIYSPPSTLAMMKAWLGFYRQHLLDLTAGRFSPFGQLKIPNHKIEAEGRTFAYIRNLDFPELSAEGKTIYIVNASDADHFSGKVRGPIGVTTYSVKVFNRYLDKELNQMTVTTDARAVLNLNIGVEQGGLIVVSAMPNKDALTLEDPDGSLLEENVSPEIREPVPGGRVRIHPR